MCFKYFALIFSLIGFLFPLNVKSNKVFQSLFINRGTLTTVKGNTFPFLAFNSTLTYNSSNAVINCLVNDTLILTVNNNDSIIHGFKVKNYSGISYTINPSANITCTLIPNQRCIYTFYDHLNFPRNTYMGLAGMIAVKEKINDKVYYWNLKEHQSLYNLQLGYNADWSVYYPDYFTINGKSFAQVQLDPTAKIQAQVNDTIYIYVQNTGQSMHSLHFHGFHPTAVYSDSKLIKSGWSKDTWGMFSMDALVLKMIPDKSGKYSVHDHNLVAVTGGNTHPNGMFTIMQINP